jgi:hypothetical protein
VKRCIGFDDGFFRKTDQRALAVGVVMRAQVVEAVLSTNIAVDGDDATAVLTKAFRDAPQRPGYILLNGLTFGGLNVVDIRALSEQTGAAVISVTRQKPDERAFSAALEHVPNSVAKQRRVANAGEMCHSTVYFQCAGVTPQAAAEFIEANTFNGKIPECIRLAHLVAQGISRGVSSGRA